MKLIPWWPALVLALLGIVVLHGCHGEDEDHELFRALPVESPWLVD